MSDPILIVGAGPTGLTAALELSRFGVPVRLVDQAEGPATTSRALGIQARTMELLEQRGLVDEILRLGNPAGFGSIYGDGKRLVRIDFSTVRSRYAYLMNLSQAETERILREAVAAAGVTIEWRTRLVGIAQDSLSHDADKVTATLERPDGTLELAHAPWLISGEGAHSLVRTTLGMSFAGETNPRHYMLGDVRVDGDLAATDFHIFGSAEGFMALFPLAPGHFRLIADNPPRGDDGGRHEGAPDLAEIQQIYDQRSTIPARFHDMSWSSWFRINSRMVDRLAVGRMFVGGDAAHIHAPAGAQGMNTGMQDMINLCWKLALVEQGQASVGLLDSYGAERLPVIRGVLGKTETITSLIGTEAPVGRMIIDHVAPLIGGLRAVQSNTANHMAQIEYGYGHSALSENHGARGSVSAGDRVPELTVRVPGAGGAVSRLLPLLDPSGFTLLVAQDGDDATIDPALASASGGVALRVVALAAASGEEDTYRHVLGGRGCVFLIRPDGYVALAASARAAPDALRGWFDRWLRPGG